MSTLLVLFVVVPIATFFLLLLGALMEMPSFKSGFVEQPVLTAFCISAIGLITATALSAWKREHRLSYGIVEAGLGLAVMFNTTLHLAPNFELAKILALASGVYIVSRGHTNIADAKKPEPTRSQAASG